MIFQMDDLPSFKDSQDIDHIVSQREVGGGKHVGLL